MILRRKHTILLNSITSMNNLVQMHSEMHSNEFNKTYIEWVAIELQLSFFPLIWRYRPCCSMSLFRCTQRAIKTSLVSDWWGLFVFYYTTGIFWIHANSAIVNHATRHDPYFYVRFSMSTTQGHCLLIFQLTSQLHHQQSRMISSDSRFGMS